MSTRCELSAPKRSIRFAVVKTDFPSFFKPTRFTVVRTDSRFAVVKIDCPTIYKPPTRFAVVKTDSTTFYKHTTRFADVNTDSSYVLYVFRFSRWNP